MLYLTVASLVLLVIGGIVIKKSSKFAGLGIIIAIVGAVASALLGYEVIRQDTNKSAKCASLDGEYGGGACYVQGVEQDLENIEKVVEHK